MAEFIGALDQGTTSTRFMIFDRGGTEIGRAQQEHEQILPRAGWVEHDPREIIDNAIRVMAQALETAGIREDQLSAIGLTNQRETTVVWDPSTGEPLFNALVWQDTRTDMLIRQIEATGGGSLIRKKAGLPPATYFSAGKMRWLLDEVEGLEQKAARGEALFGTIDSWVLWNLTGGPSGGIHETDVTNASRTMLMNLETLDWDPELLELFDIPRETLPVIRPSSGNFGTLSRVGSLRGGVPICGVLGDQQAATVGQVCFESGQAKNTYGTGNFMLLNTGAERIVSRNGLLTTVAYQWNKAPAIYALEGSIAVTGSAVQWFRDQLGIIQTAAEIEELALTVEDSAGVYFVPAFSGLFAPYWRSDARGVIAGLTRFAHRGHLARATLEAICYQSRDVIEAMKQDSELELDVIKVDGGATVNDTLMQLQADITGVSVVRPEVAETTSLGAAYSAGLASGFWKNESELTRNWNADRIWEPRWSEERREKAYAGWKKAVERTLDWV